MLIEIVLIQDVNVEVKMQVFFPKLHLFQLDLYKHVTAVAASIRLSRQINYV